jgi:hypothetical protein
MLYHSPPEVSTTSAGRRIAQGSGSRNAKLASTQQQVTVLVDRTMHHANHPTEIPGKPLLGHLTSSRRIQAGT